MEAFVADYGASRFLDPESSDQTMVAGTYGYIALGYLISSPIHDFAFHFF